MHSSERIEEMVCELQGYRWDAILMSETWRPDRNLRDTHKNTYSWEQENMITNAVLKLC